MRLKELARELTERPVPVQIRGWTGAGKTTFTKCIVREVGDIEVLSTKGEWGLDPRPLALEALQSLLESAPSVLPALFAEVVHRRGRTSGGWTFQAVADSLEMISEPTLEAFLAALEALERRPGYRAAPGAEAARRLIGWFRKDRELAALVIVIARTVTGTRRFTVLDDVPQDFVDLVTREVVKCRQSAPLILLIPDAALAHTEVFPVSVWVGAVHCDEATAARWRVPRDALRYQRGVAWALIRGRWERVEFKPLPEPRSASGPTVPVPARKLELPRPVAPAPTATLEVPEKPERPPAKQQATTPRAVAELDGERARALAKLFEAARKLDAEKLLALAELIQSVIANSEAFDLLANFDRRIRELEDFRDNAAFVVEAEQLLIDELGKIVERAKSDAEDIKKLKQSLQRRCAACGAELPPYWPAHWQLCDDCFKKQRRQ